MPYCTLSYFVLLHDLVPLSAPLCTKPLTPYAPCLRRHPKGRALRPGASNVYHVVADSTSINSPVPGSSPPSKSYFPSAKLNGATPLNGHAVSPGFTSSKGSPSLPNGCSLPNGDAAVSQADASMLIKANGAAPVSSFAAVEAHKWDGLANGGAARANGIGPKQVGGLSGRPGVVGGSEKRPSGVVGEHFASFGDEELVYEKLPQDIADRHVLLMDPILGAGSSAVRAIQVTLRSFWLACGSSTAPAHNPTHTKPSLFKRYLHLVHFSFFKNPRPVDHGVESGGGWCAKARLGLGGRVMLLLDGLCQAYQITILVQTSSLFLLSHLLAWEVPRFPDAAKAWACPPCSTDVRCH